MYRMAKTRRRTRRYKKKTHRSVKQKGGIIGQSTPRPEKIAKIKKWLNADNTLCNEIQFPQSCPSSCKKQESPTENVYSTFNDFRKTEQKNSLDTEEGIYENLDTIYENINPIYENIDLIDKNLPSQNADMNTQSSNEAIYTTVLTKAEREKGRTTPQQTIVHNGYQIPYEKAGGRKRKTRRRRANKRRGRKTKRS